MIKQKKLASHTQAVLKKTQSQQRQVQVKKLLQQSRKHIICKSLLEQPKQDKLNIVLDADLQFNSPDNHITRNTWKQQCLVIERTCPVCYCKIELNNLRQPCTNCSHEICLQCLNEYLQNTYNSKKKLSDFKCPQEGCSELINYEVLVNLLKPEQLNNLDEFNAKLFTNMQCPNTHCQFQFFFEDNEQNIVCPRCSQEICYKCKNITHPDQKCLQNQIKEAYQLLEQQYKNERIRFCPFCNFPQVKDNKCEHVTCNNENCPGQLDKQFCFACSAPQLPIFSHGNHYHRSDCPLYSPWLDPQSKKEVVTDEFNPKACKLCQINQKPCQRPSLTYKQFEQIISQVHNLNIKQGNQHDARKKKNDNQIKQIQEKSAENIKQQAHIKKMKKKNEQNVKTVLRSYKNNSLELRSRSVNK